MPSPLTVDATGAFTAVGTFVREHGGPIRDGELLDVHPAIYSGTVTGTTMRLSLRVTDTNDPSVSFSLSRGAPGRVVKCL